MEVRDPVHNFIDFDDKEKDIIDHPAFQRLRRISQLAMSSLVYPGAVHNRFEHSLGVCYIAGRIAERVLDDKDTIKYVRLATLVHDIGHGPFSHVSEAPLARVNRQWLEETGIKEDKIHECIGVDIVEHQLRKDGWLTNKEKAKVIEILDTVNYTKRCIERDIASGPLDADKMDYLLRDSFHCGVKYGVFDVERLVRALVRASDGKSHFVGVRGEDVPVVDQYVIARYNMHSQVYGHKTRRATDLMLERAITSAIEANDEEIVRAYTYTPDSKEFTDQYLMFDDRMLLDLLSKSKSESAKKLAGHLTQRRLPSRILYRSLGDLSDDVLREKLRDDKQRGPALDDLRREICSRLNGFDADCIFVVVEDTKAVAKFPSLKNIDPEQIHVVSDGWAQPKTLAKASNFFRDYKFTPKAHIAVYVGLDDPRGTSREVKKSQALEKLHDVLASVDGGELQKEEG